MNVCIISNKQNLEHNYSRFIDSCEKVMRISKMDNLDSGQAGTKTDIAFVSVCSAYFWHSRQKRHVDVLKTVPEIYFNNEDWNRTLQFVKNEQIENWQFIPKEISAMTCNFTTVGKAIPLASSLYPDAQLYYLGDVKAAIRAPGSPKHGPFHKKETDMITSLINSGRLIDITNDPRFYD